MTMIAGRPISPCPPKKLHDTLYVKPPTMNMRDLGPYTEGAVETHLFPPGVVDLSQSGENWRCSLGLHETSIGCRNQPVPPTAFPSTRIRDTRKLVGGFLLSNILAAPNLADIVNSARRVTLPIVDPIRPIRDI